MWSRTAFFRWGRLVACATVCNRRTSGGLEIRRRLQACPTILGIALFAFAAAAQEQPGSIGGIVTDAISHQPVRKATVRVVHPVLNDQLSARAVTTTDATGAFTLTSLPPGTYRVMATHPNFPIGLGQTNNSVEVKAGEKSSLNLELIPGASVSGRVLDEDGDPLPSCAVQPHPAKHRERGIPFQGGGAANEDGEYRLYGIPPGKYVLSAQCHVAVFQPRPFSSGPDPPPASAYPTQFYPLASDAKSAEAIDLAAGSEKAGIDFRMRPAPVTQIHGRFSPTGADWHGAGNLVVQLIPLDPAGAVGLTSGAAVDPVKGTFEIRQVFPGSYTVVVNSNDQEHRVGAFQRIEVKDRPLDLVLELRHAIDLSGTVQIDGKIPLDQINVQLTPEGYQVQQPTQSQVKEDGTFTLTSIVPGRWKLGVNAPMGFLKSAWLGTENVTDQALDLSSGAVGPLRVVVSANVGSIQGTGPPGFSVLAEVIQGNTIHTGFGTNIEPSGRFTIGGVAPGKYRVVAYEAGPAPEDGGQEVTIREGETVTVELKP
jgi:hypothetical protein